MSKEIQEYKIMRYIRKHGSISQLDASDQLRITRLSARIWDMKHKGVPVWDAWHEKENLDGSKTRYKRYYIDKEYFEQAVNK